MNKKLFAIVALLAAGIAVADDDGITWPDGATVAVSLSYDDTLESQLDNAVPVLDEQGFKATFYLTVGRDGMRDRLDDWRALAAAGHELGNHTIYHPCRASLPDREWVPPQHDVDHKTVAQMREEILVASTFLTAVDGRTQRTYAATCYDLDASDGNYLEAIEGDFVAIRDLDQGVPAANKRIWGPGEGTSGEELIGYVRDNSQPGNLVSLVFHGVGGDYIAVSADAHAELVRFLAANADTYWVDTYENIMTHVKEQLAAGASP